MHLQPNAIFTISVPSSSKFVFTRHRKCNNNQMKCVCAQIFTLYLRQSNCQMMKKNIAAMKYETDPSRSGPQSIAKEVGSVDNC